MKRSIFFLLCASIGIVATAQTFNKERLIDECQRLYSDGEFATALSLLEKLDTVKMDKEERQEAELLIALTTYENNAIAGQELMFDYLKKYPESTQRELLNCYIAQAYYHDGKYRKACDLFEKCNLENLTTKQRDAAKLYYALSLVNTGNEGIGESMLNGLISSDYYSTDARFHLAVIKYNRDELFAAQVDLEECENRKDKHYTEKLEYYSVGINIKEGDYDEALRRANHFIDEYGTKPQGIRMHQMLGAAYFMKDDFENAAKALDIYVKEYEKEKKRPQRIARYQYGKSMYELGKHDEALKQFTICADGDDAIAQNSLLHIGLIHLEKGNTKDARLTLGGAANMKNDERVREEALYNYAMCIHETNYSPFGENVKTFEQFLNDYPNSQYADKVSEILVEEYTKTHDYEIALQSINKIKNPSAKILEAKMKILYQKGIQEFVNGDMDEAINYLDQALELGENNKGTDDSVQSWMGEAQFWKGEALYRKGKMGDARNCYGKALGIDEKGNLKAYYCIGYTHFKEEDYDKARRQFDKFAQVASTEGYDLLADTYSRIADCYFYQKDYTKAEENYNKSINSDKLGDISYPLYRQAQIMGLKNNKDKCIAALEELIEKHPNSQHTKQAMYELGRVYIKDEQYDKAINTYNKLIEKFPDSDIARRASTERAMIYNTIGDSKNAIKAYKDIIKLYPNSEEALVAAQDYKNISVDLGIVDEYAEYMSDKGNVMKVNSSEIDTLAYTAAEKVYRRGDLNNAMTAFDNYLKSHPNGAFRGNSYYYKGLISYNQGNKEEALNCFEHVYNLPNNKHCEDAMMLAAEIYYSKMEFDKSMPLDKKIAEQSKKSERRNKALTRVILAAFKLQKYDEVIEYATTIEKDSNFSPEFKREAMLYRAKAYLALKDNDKAIDELDKLAENTRTKEGAEAKYLVAQLLFDEENYEYCEDEINEFIEMSTPHVYWMARSFILLADLYTVQEKTMEAKQYLLSLQNNYEGEDDIASMIEDRLSKLSNKN